MEQAFFPKTDRMRFYLVIGLVIAPLVACDRLEITQRGVAFQTHDHGSGLYPAEKAIDGDLESFNHTASTAPGAAWNLEFPEEEQITRIEIVPRNCCSGRLTGATLRLFNVGETQVFEETITDTGPLTVMGYDFPEGISAKRIRVGFEPPQNGIVHLAEFRVFAAGGEPPVIDSFTAANGNLTWSVSGADEVKIHGIGPVAAAGSMIVSPTESQAYVLSATNNCTTVHASAAIEIGGNLLRPKITEVKAFPEDWVEIWNPSDREVNLTGWTLTDDFLHQSKWVFPPRQVIAPGEMLVIEDPFGLAREADSYVALLDQAGEPVSILIYPRQYEGGSYGENLDGEWQYFLEASPGAFNFGPTTEGFLEGVNSSHIRGFYTEPFALTLSSKSKGASVLYSLDGSVPTLPFDSSNPPFINTTTIVRSKEVRKGFVDSPIETHSYFYLADVAQQPEFPAGFPVDWQPPGATGGLAPIPRPSDYEMDPLVQGDMIAALQQVPTLSITLPVDEMWGIENGLHPNGTNRGRDWEKEVSLEIIDPVQGTNAHYNCGLRIHGGRGRIREMLRKSFRLYFRSEYGASKFDEALFPRMPEGGVDHLVLRAGTGRTWASPWRDRTGSGNSLTRVTYLRDQFYRDSQAAMGNPSLSGCFAHLYLNGLYWGLYNPVERPGENYGANHFGGDEEDYDVLKWANGLATQVTHGEIDGWEELRGLTGGTPADDWEQIQQRLDVPNLIDYMMVNFYVGNQDWVRNNVYAFRRREGGEDNRFRFLCWDGEETFLNLSRNSTTDGRDKTTTPLELHDDLRVGSLEYRMMFADRIHRHLVDEEGVLTSGVAQTRHQQMVASVDQAIIAESARWGDLFIDDAANPGLRYTREDHWLPEVANIENNYLAKRPATALNHMAADGLYPATAAPVATLTNSSLQLTAPEGTIYFMRDGSDPRLSGGAVHPEALVFSAESVGDVLVKNDANWRYFDADQDLSGTNWQGLDFDDSGWASGPAPLGYGTVSGFNISTEISFGDHQFDKPITAYFRHRFQLDEPAKIETLSLNYIRDDGAVFYLNGQEIERSNLPVGAITADTLALENGDETALFSKTVSPSLLVPGENVLAVEIHQRSAGSSDMGFEVSLVSVREGLPVEGDLRVRTRALNAGQWSALEDETWRVQIPSQTMVLTEIMYHPGPLTAEEMKAGILDDDDFEFLELKNVSAGDLLLDGFRFSKGINLPLSGTLSAGETALVVKNRVAFEFRYGTSHRILAEWGEDQRLKNGGELIRLRDHKNEVVFEVEYGDNHPWTNLPDGRGSSLVLRSPDIFPNLNDPENWRASASAGGSPGTIDTTTFTGTTEAELLEYAILAIEEVNASGELTAEINILADDVTIVLEVSNDLVDWEVSEATFWIERIPGAREMSFVPIQDEHKKYYRFRVTRN